MGVNFNGVNSYINFGAIVNNQIVRSVSAHVYLDTLPSAEPDPYHTIIYHTGGGWTLSVIESGTLMFLQGFSTTGMRAQTSTTLSTLAWNHVAITYNGSLPGNEPIFYVGGGVSSSSITQAGEGTMGDDSDGLLCVGGVPFVDWLDGKLQDVRIYNRILSANEVEILAKSHCQNVVLNGLVFWAPLNGAADLPSFEGATMGASNYVRDVISGAIGTPVGNPLGAGNTIQRIR